MFEETFSPANAISLIRPSGCCPHCHRTSFVVVDERENYTEYECNTCHGQWRLGYTVVLTCAILPPKKVEAPKLSDRLVHDKDVSRISPIVRGKW